MSDNQRQYLTDTTCHLHVPCTSYPVSKSRCSVKSHSSSCLSSPYETGVFHGGGCSLWFKDNEFPSLLPPTTNTEHKKKKKKVFTIDVVPGTGKGLSSSSKPHKCHKSSCKRQRLHSDASSNRRGSLRARNDFEQSKRARLAVVVVALSLIMLSVLLVGITLRMAPIIDELVRKGNEDIYRSMTAGASTSSPTTDGAIVSNTTAPSTGTPG